MNELSRTRPPASRPPSMASAAEGRGGGRARFDNLSIIEHRWPAVAAVLATSAFPDDVVLLRARQETMSVDGFQLTSAYDREAEAQLQASLVPNDARVATVYGIGLGDVARVLLARPALERLSLVVLSTAVARASFALFDHRDWLRDERVELVIARPSDGLARPFAVVAPCLRLAEPCGHAVRDALVRELNAPFVADHWRRREPELRERIAVGSRRFASDHDVSTAFGRAHGRTVAVCGGGPTLSAGVERLRAERGHAIVVAATTALRPLAKAGLTADYAVVLDPDVSFEHHLGGLPDRALASTTLLYAPVAQPALIAAWPGPRLVYHVDHPIYTSAPAAKTRLFAAGTVVHPALDFAVRAGASRVVMYGLDFAYVGSRTHAVGAPDATDAGADRAARFPVENGRGEFVSSDANLIQYLRATEHFIARSPGVRFVSASAEGACVRGAEIEVWS